MPLVSLPELTSRLGRTPLTDPRSLSSSLLFHAMMLLVASIILVQPIMTTPTGTMATVMSLLPFSSPIIMPLVMSATQVPIWQVTTSIAVLLLSCLGAIWISARIYRVGLLMTGKRPSIKELVRWVRFA